MISIVSLSASSKSHYIDTDGKILNHSNTQEAVEFLVHFFHSSYKRKLLELVQI